MALLNDDALLASTNAFIPFIIIPPMAAMPWIIAKAGIALFVPYTLTRCCRPLLHVI